MIYYYNERLSCLTCITGHRAAGCMHIEKDLYSISGRGRPNTTYGKVRYVFPAGSISLCALTMMPIFKTIGGQNGQPATRKLTRYAECLHVDPKTPFRTVEISRLPSPASEAKEKQSKHDMFIQPFLKMGTYFQKNTTITVFDHSKDTKALDGAEVEERPIKSVLAKVTPYKFVDDDTVYYTLSPARPDECPLPLHAQEQDTPEKYVGKLKKLRASIKRVQSPSRAPDKLVIVSSEQGFERVKQDSLQVGLRAPDWQATKLLYEPLAQDKKQGVIFKEEGSTPTKDVVKPEGDEPESLVGTTESPSTSSSSEGPPVSPNLTPNQLLLQQVLDGMQRSKHDENGRQRAKLLHRQSQEALLRPHRLLSVHQRLQQHSGHSDKSSSFGSLSSDDISSLGSGLEDETRSQGQVSNDSGPQGPSTLDILCSRSSISLDDPGVYELALGLTALQQTEFLSRPQSFNGSDGSESEQQNESQFSTSNTYQPQPHHYQVFPVNYGSFNGDPYCYGDSSFSPSQIQPHAVTNGYRQTAQFQFTESLIRSTLANFPPEIVDPPMNTDKPQGTGNPFEPGSASGHPVEPLGTNRSSVKDQLEAGGTPNELSAEERILFSDHLYENDDYDASYDPTTEYLRMNFP